MARSALSIFIFKRLQLSQSLPSGHAPALYSTPLLSGDPPLQSLLTIILPSGLWPYRPGSAVALPVASAPQFRKLSLWLGPQSPSSPPATQDPQLLLSVLSPQVHFPHLHLSFLQPHPGLASYCFHLSNGLALFKMLIATVSGHLSGPLHLISARCLT